MHRVIFHEKENSFRLEKDGYATFNLLGIEEVELMKKIFSDNHEADPSGFYATTHIRQ
jgi:hypothetical protein